MSIRLNQLHAQYAHRREAENHRVERVQAVNRYYDHWGKVTSRFDNWTNSEYYENAEKQQRQGRDKAEKERTMAERRMRLKQLLKNEQGNYELEMEMRKRPKPRKLPEDVELLSRISQSAKDREQLKRKLEMEAKLYGRWRHGVDDEQLLFDTKSDHQVLAKLNWLDKQIEGQVQRERDEALSQERNLRLQEELHKTVQAQKERQQIREQEIKEICALQERHMTEMKERQQQSDSLKEEEKHLRVFLSEIDKERELLEESSKFVLQRPDYSKAYNLKKIKVFIRERSQTFRKQIELCIHMLERMCAFGTKCDSARSLMQKYKDQLESEALAYGQIETMYESEAKYNLQNCETNWRDQHLQRYNELKQLLDDETHKMQALIAENLRQQEEIVETRSMHLTAIESSSEQLKQLYTEQEQSVAGDDAASVLSSVAPEAVSLPSTSRAAVLSTTSADARSGAGDSNSLLPRVTNSFSHLNLDWESVPTTRDDADALRLSKTRSSNVVTASNAERPKYARRRVAWN